MGSPIIFNGTFAKTLTDNLKLKENIQVLSGDTDDPTSVAKDAPAGSLYIRSGTDEIYKKTDSGSSTNWVQLLDTTDISDAVTNAGTSTDNAIARFDGTTGKIVQNSGVTIDDSDNVIIAGDLTVNGTTTTINTATLDVEDQNITVNVNGNDASSEGAGLTVNRTSTDGSFVYEDALTSKWKLGALGSEIEVTTVSDTQTLTNKSIDADSNTVTNIDNADIKTSAAIDATKIADGSVNNTEFQTLNGVTSSIQTQIDGKQDEVLTTKGDLVSRTTVATTRLAVGTDGQSLIADSAEATGLRWGSVTANPFSVNSVSGVQALSANETYLVDTSGGVGTLTLPAPAANTYVYVKDKGNALTNNITVNPNAAEDIDGASSYVIDSNYGAKLFVSDGTDWFIL